MLNRPPLLITALGSVVAVVGLSGCGAGSGTTAAPSPSSSATTTITASPPSSAPETSAGRPTSESPKSQSGPRTVAQLKSALLELSDLPSGFALEPSESGGADDSSASSKNSTCGPLVKITNADVAPGSKASAKASFSGGQDGPFVEESIDALASADAVKALQASYKAAVAACRQLMVTIPGQGKSSMTVTEVSAPKFGDDPYAVRMTATSGPLEGLEIMQVTAGVKDTVVSITFVAANPDDVDGGAEAAIGKANELLGGANAGA